MTLMAHLTMHVHDVRPREAGYHWKVRGWSDFAETPQDGASLRRVRALTERARIISRNTGCRVRGRINHCLNLSSFDRFTSSLDEGNG